MSTCLTNKMGADQVVAGEQVGAGAWMYHCHVQSHSDMGMAGLFLVAKPDGTIPGYEPHHPAGANPDADPDPGAGANPDGDAKTGGHNH